MLDIYTVLVASGRLTVQKASGTRRAPSIRWNALAAPQSLESHCATVRCSHPNLGPRTRPSEERLQFSLRPGQDTRPPSSERLEFLCSHPIAASIWSNRCNPGTVYALPEEDAIAERRMLIARSGDERQQRVPLLRWLRVLQGSLARVPDLRSSGGNFDKKCSLVWSLRSPETNIASDQVLLTNTPHLYCGSTGSMLTRHRSNGPEELDRRRGMANLSGRVIQRHCVVSLCTVHKVLAKKTSNIHCGLMADEAPHTCELESSNFALQSTVRFGTMSCCNPRRY